MENKNLEKRNKLPAHQKQNQSIQLSSLPLPGGGVDAGNWAGGGEHNDGEHDIDEILLIAEFLINVYRAVCVCVCVSWIVWGGGGTTTTTTTRYIILFSFLHNIYSYKCVRLCSECLSVCLCEISRVFRCFISLSLISKTRA